MKPAANNVPEDQSQRLDTWLWASRFYKSRKISSDEIKAGHVLVNGKRGKPAKLVKVDDVLRIRRVNQLFTVVIAGLSEKRLGAPLAAALYEETEQSRSEREEKAVAARMQRESIRYDRARPSSRDRRKMTRIKNQPEGFDQ